MSLELALISGLGLAAVLTFKLLEKFKDEEEDLNLAALVLSSFFILGMVYTGHGIAASSSYSNASNAYLLAALILVLIFLGLLVKFLVELKIGLEDTDELEGF